MYDDFLGQPNRARRGRFTYDHGFEAPLYSRGFLPLLAGALIAGGIGAAGSVVGSMIQSRAQKRAIDSSNAANELNYARALGIGGDMQVAAGRYAQTGRRLFDARVETTKAIQTQAIGEIGKIGGVARRDIIRRGQGYTAQATAGAQARGLSNSTVADATRRGVFDDTNQALLNLDERLAGLRAGALQAFSNSMERVTGDRASFEGEVFRSQFSALQSILGTISQRQDVPYTPATPNYAAIGQGVGNLAMLAMMASGGGAAGAYNAAGAVPGAPASYYSYGPTPY